MPVVRVSVMRVDPDAFDRFAAAMAEAETVLRPGIAAMPGLLAYFAGADRASASLTNTSVWESLEAAQQMDRFQPMLDHGRRFAEAGARFDRPIMNYQVQWQIGGAAP